MGPHPAVAAIRLAVRRVLHDVLTDYAAAERAGATARAEAAHPGGAVPPADTGPCADTAHTPLLAPTPRLADSAGESTAPPRPGPPPPARHVDAAPLAAPGAGPRRPLEPSGPLVLVACSGGADSMALASALAFEAPKLGIRAGGITIDHGLQEGSGIRAAEVAGRLTALGLSPVESVSVIVGQETRMAHSASYRGGVRREADGADDVRSAEGDAGLEASAGAPSASLKAVGEPSSQRGRVSGGPEADARDARYAALDAAAERLGAVAVLLGHTRDDQAETVLLGLARGSGTRSLSGMAAVSGTAGRYRRPFLHLDRQTARRACLAQSLPVWDDPHNTDPTFTRSRLRHEGLPALEKALGKGVVEALARTAWLSRDDADALDAWADQAETAVRDASGRMECAKLGALPPAVRRRVLRRAAIGAGAPAGSLFARHIEEIDRLITGWRGQGVINLPGKVVAQRQDGRLVIRQG